ncbi:CPBP family intramembrane glutamic endopeptidase [Kribbella deserti]|uniref:CPBP family intramembrane glutamic endopeptidase n=1 Tax=Kribbella deserti TaxID=1926257 RepID=A0ABV6QHY5_9ACTN
MNSAQKGNDLSRVSHRTGIIVFVVLAFGLTWPWLFIARLGLGLSLVNPLVQLPIAFSPAIAAFVVRRWVTREGFGDAGLALKLRTAWPHYLAAYLGPLAIAVATCLLAAGLGLWTPNLSGLENGGLPWWVTVAGWMLAALVLTPVYFGEEFGWTSYLRLRLFPGRPYRALLATGLIWAVWHYPLAFLGYAEFSNVVAGLAVWTVSFLLQEVILSWLRLRSGTIWTASLAHAGNNLVLSVLTAVLLTAGEGGALDAILVTLLMLVPLAVISGWLLLTGRLLPPANPAGPAQRPQPSQPATSAP